MDPVELQAIIERERERQRTRAARAESQGGAFDRILNRWVEMRVQGKTPRDCVAGESPKPAHNPLPPLAALPLPFCCVVTSTLEV